MPPEHKNNTDMRKDYQKLDEISFQRLSHAELCSLMNLLAGCMEQTGAEALHIEAQEIMEIKELTALLTDGMTEPTACAETPQIQQLVADQRKLIEVVSRISPLPLELGLALAAPETLDADAHAARPLPQPDPDALCRDERGGEKALPRVSTTYRLS